MLNRTEAAGVVTLTLARAERGNALSAALVHALQQGVDAAVADPGVHTLVLRGEGRHFCTGLDLSDLEGATDGDLLLRLVHVELLLTTLWHAPLRTVALAQGRAWGAGADLFAACEQRIALPQASFRFPGVHFGVVLGSRRLAERLGADLARQVLIEARDLDADAALASGLASGQAESAEQALQALAPPRVGRETAAALRAATRSTGGGNPASGADVDLAALVRSAAVPGLRQRIADYRDRLRG